MSRIGHQVIWVDVDGNKHHEPKYFGPNSPTDAENRKRELERQRDAGQQISAPLEDSNGKPISSSFPRLIREVWVEMVPQ